MLCGTVQTFEALEAAILLFLGAPPLLPLVMNLLACVDYACLYSNNLMHPWARIHCADFVSQTLDAAGDDGHRYQRAGALFTNRKNSGWLRCISSNRNQIVLLRRIWTSLKSFRELENSQRPFVGALIL